MITQSASDAWCFSPGETRNRASYRRTASYSLIDISIRSTQVSSSHSQNQSPPGTTGLKPSLISLTRSLMLRNNACSLPSGLRGRAASPSGAAVAGRSRDLACLSSLGVDDRSGRMQPKPPGAGDDEGDLFDRHEQDAPAQ